MRGHIQQRGKRSWRVKVFVGRDAAGARRYVERTVRGTRREAERELARVVVEVGEGRHAAAAPMGFGELLDRWLDVKRRTVEPSTLSSYEWIARTYVRPALGERTVGSLRPIDLDALYADLHERGLSARTVRICHGDAPVARAGEAVGADRPQPFRRRHAAAAAATGGGAADGRAGARALRRRR